MTSLKCRASDMGHTFERVPQILKNIHTTQRIDLETPLIKEAILNSQKELGENGRIWSVHQVQSQ